MDITSRQPVAPVHETRPDLVARFRHIARHAPAFAILAAIGTYWLVSSLAIGVLVSASMFVRLPVSGSYLPAAAFLASAGASAVAFRAGGWTGFVGLCVLAVIYELLLVCPPAGTALGPATCDPARVFSAHIAETAGGFIGLPLALTLRTQDRMSALLLAAAVMAVTRSLLPVVFALLGPLTGPAAYERYLWVIRLEAGAAIGAGAIIAWRSRRPLASGLVLAAALLLPWSGGLRSWLDDTAFLRTHGILINLPVIIQTQWEFFLPPVFAVCVGLGFLAERIGIELTRRVRSRVYSPASADDYLE